jgi:hypothetical protein
MYVLGGADVGAVTASVHKFDSTQGTWSQVAPMPAVRCGHAACAIGSDIYVFGGENGDDRDQPSVFKYDTEANEWSTLAPMPHASVLHNASVLGGLVYIVGAGASCREVLRFDSTSDVWSTLAPVSIISRFGASFVLGGCLYAAAGAGVEVYNVASNTWTAVAAGMLVPRKFFNAVTITSTVPADEQNLFDALIAKVPKQK